MDKTFKPTELDIALRSDPVTEASTKAIQAAASESGSVLEEAEDLSQSVDQATRGGQRETAAASLAAGMIAAQGKPVSAAEAVQKTRDVLDEMNR